PASAASPPGSRVPGPGVRPQTPEERQRDIELLHGHPAFGSEDGERLRQWVAAWTIELGGVEVAIESIPPHCAYIFARLARTCAREYAEFVAQVDPQAR
ncbi:hypothetical protein AB0M46_39300, partial [Dactylosporangium sp. NPDC051485]|uniref:hypothetical protein n=1 Tax=Dactylosporangium sp. NPDC051485 TaxID=3154846 RepID=UPI0034337064